MDELYRLYRLRSQRNPAPDSTNILFSQSAFLDRFPDRPCGQPESDVDPGCQAEDEQSYSDRHLIRDSLVYGAGFPPDSGLRSALGLAVPRPQVPIWCGQDDGVLEPIAPP